MPRRSGRIGSGTLLDELIVRVTSVYDGRGVAQAIADIGALKTAVSGGVVGTGANTLQGAMTAALVAPVIAATGHLRQMRSEVRMLTSEMRSVGMIGFGGPAPGGRSSGGLVVAPVPGVPSVVDVPRNSTLARLPNGRWARSYGGEGDDLAGAARGQFGEGGAAPRRGNWFSRMMDRERERTAGAFESGRNNFPGFGDASENLGAGAHSVGAAGRRAAGSRIASALGLVGLGALFGDLVKLAASLATVIGGTLTGAFAALATPLGAVIALVTALVGLFVAANWDQFREFGEWFADRWRDVIGGEGMADIVSGWNNLTGAFVELWNALKAMFSEDDSRSITAILQFFGEVAIRVVNAVMELLGAFLRTLGEIVRAIAALLRGDLVGAFNHLGEAVRSVFRGLLDTIGSLFPEIQTRIDDIATWIEDRFRAMGETVGSVLGGMSRGGSAPPSNLGGARGDGTVRGGPGNDTLGGGSKGLRTPGFSKYGTNHSIAQFAGIEGATGGDPSPLMQRVRGAAEAMGDALARAFSNGAQGGVRMKDVLRQLQYELGQIVLQAALLDPIRDGIQNVIGGIFGGNGKKRAANDNNPLASLAASLFGGFFANGGNLAPGQWGIVGEKGPEIARGGRYGLSIAPMSGGGGSNITYAPSYSFTGTAEEIAAVRRMVEQDRESFTTRWKATAGNERSRGRF